MGKRQHDGTTPTDSQGATPASFFPEGDYAGWSALSEWTAYEAMSLLTDRQMPPYLTLLDGFDPKRVEEGRKTEGTRNVLERVNANQAMESIRIRASAAIALKQLDAWTDNATGQTYATPQEWITWASKAGIEIPQPLRSLALTVEDAPPISPHAQQLPNQVEVSVNAACDVTVSASHFGAKPVQVVFSGRNGNPLKQGRALMLMAYYWPKEVTAKVLIQELDNPEDGKAVKRVVSLIGDIRKKLEQAGINPDLVKPLTWALVRKHPQAASTKLTCTNLKGRNFKFSDHFSSLDDNL